MIVNVYMFGFCCVVRWKGEVARIGYCVGCMSVYLGNGGVRGLCRIVETGKGVLNLFFVRDKFRSSYFIGNSILVRIRREGMLWS